MRSALLTIGLAAVPTLAAAQTTPARPAATSPAITAADLRTRSFIFAADSMEGRMTASRGHVKATDYIAAELKRLGLEPAGENGTFFQTLPVVQRELDTKALPAVAARAFAPSSDFIARDQGPRARSIDGAGVIWGGMASDSAPAITPEQAAGKFVLLGMPADLANTPNRQMMTMRFLGAAGIGIVMLERLPEQLRAMLQASGPSMPAPAEGPEVPVYAYVSTAMADALLGAPSASAKPGQAGQVVRGTIRFVERPVAFPARNVVAVARGTNPALRNTYVAVGAHSDHDGMGPAVDHDSLHIGNALFRKEGADQPPTNLTAAQWDTLKAALDSVRRTRPARRDSIFNGADDDNSGSMGLLELAEYFAAAPKARPQRSVLFVWHVAEELGLWGSEWFTDHPTVPRDSIVAAINLDMIGRGAKSDVPPGYGPGGDDYLQLLGSRRLSTTYGDFVEAVNKASANRFRLDYTYDAKGHPQQYYCRSDHWNYARYGIPTVFFSTGGHMDYHMQSDEPQYLDYPHFERVVRFVADLARQAANRADRFAVDKPVPGPKAQCEQ